MAEKSYTPPSSLLFSREESIYFRGKERRNILESKKVFHSSKTIASPNLQRATIDSLTSNLYRAILFQLLSLGREPKVLLSRDFTADNNSPVVDVSWLPSDNGLIISTHGNGMFRLWESRWLQVAASVRLGSNTLYCHAMSPKQTIPTVAIGCMDDTKLLDLRTMTCMQQLANSKKTKSIIWDPLEEFAVYCGMSNGSIHSWDIRNPSRVKATLMSPFKNDKNNGSTILQMNVLNPGCLLAISADGFLTLSSLCKYGTILWRTEMSFECLVGFHAAVLYDRGSTPMLLCPASDTIHAFNLLSGEEIWSRSCMDFRSDILLYSERNGQLVNCSFSDPFVNIIDL